MSLLFIRLPPDLHRCIGLLCPEMVPRLSQTCSHLYRNLSSIYNQCSHKILLKKKEVKDYWNNGKGHNYAIFQDIICKYYILYRINQCPSSMSLIADENTLRIVGYFVLWSSYKYKSHDILDMRTRQHFLLKRLGCIQRNPHYVRDTLLTDLDGYYNNMDNNFSLYLYLHMNMLVANKPHDSVLVFKTYNSDEIALLEPMIKRECQKLYEALRSHYSN